MGVRSSIKANPVRAGDAKPRDPRGQPGYRTEKVLTMLINSELPSTQGTAVIVEDDLDIRNLMCAVLRQAGFDVHPAATGLEGVELVRSTRAAIVTVDIGLPDIDGYEVVRRIRDFSDCHVLVVSGRTGEADIDAAFKGGADDYLSKPFRPRELSARVGAVAQGLLNGAAHNTPKLRQPRRDRFPAGPAVRRSVRPLTEASYSPLFLPATTSRARTTTRKTA
jgi:CheY-like chemotaxis protein